MKIVVMGEGKTDVGYRDTYNHFVEGPVCVLLKRILKEHDVPVEFVFLEKADRKRQSTPRLQRSLKKLKGHGLYSYWEKLQAVEQSADAVLFYSDADKESGENNKDSKICEKRFEDVKSGIVSGFDFCSSKEFNQIFSISAVAVKMIESWLMADPNAFEVAFGKSKNKKIDKLFPKKPELEWGAKEDKNSNYPKNQMDRLLACYNETANCESFCQIAENLSLDVAKEKCPISFDDFYQQVNTLGQKINQ